MILNKEKGQRMWGGGSGSGSGGTGSSGGGGGGGGSVPYAAEAGHAASADEATLATEAQNLTSNSTDWLKIARKDIEQTIAEVWTFAKGIVSTLRSYFNGGVTVSKESGDTGNALVVTGGTQTDTLQTTGNASVGGTLGVAGNTTVGGTLNVTGKTTGTTADFTDVTMDNLGKNNDRVVKIWADDIDAKDIATENLNVTKEAHFTKLVVDELLSNKGAIIISSANCVAEAVAEYGQYYAVFFSMTDGNGNAVINPWRHGDLALCLTFKAEGAGTFNDAKNRYYWRKVIAVNSNVTYDGNWYHLVCLSKVSGEYEGSTVPEIGDNIVQLGYTGSDAAYRQSAVILSGYPTMDAGVTPPSLAFYKGINDFSLSTHRYTFVDGLSNEFIGNFKIFVNGSATDITTFFATAAGLQAEVTNRTNADQALSNGMSHLQMAWNKIALSVFSLVNLSNKSSFTQTDTTTEWASDSDGKALVADETFSSYKPTELVTSFDYSYTTYPYSGGQQIAVYGFINGSSSRSFEVSVAIASDGSATAVVVTGGSNVDAEVSTNGTTGHVNVYVRNGGADISSAHVRISPRWGVITISNIIVADTDESHAFRRTGIDVTAGQIDLIADKVRFLNSSGTVSGKVSIDATKGTLITHDAVLRGNLFLPYLRLTSSNINDYRVTNFAGETVVNLGATGNNLQVEVSGVTIRLPKITEDMLGCEINIFNATTGTIVISGSGNNSSAQGAYFCNLLVPSQATDLRTNSTVTLQKFCELKAKAFYHGQSNDEAFNYGWLVCYANINP